jgi:hypothetical protein
MKKEELIAMGLTEEQASKVLEAVKGYVPKESLTAVETELKTAQAAVKERDGQLEDLKKTTGDVATLTQTITDLQTANKTKDEEHAAELKKLKLDNAIEKGLLDAKAKNSKAVQAMLDLEKVKLNEDGSLSGLTEQLEGLKKSDGYMFDTDQQKQPQFKGFQPGASSDQLPNTASAEYETKLANARKNNNTLEVIKIKQDAAANGVVLM